MTQLTWVDIEEVLKVVNKSRDRSDHSWRWPANTECKYVNLTIDMRDGHCLIRDRHNKEIELKDLEYQYKGEE